MRTYVIVGNKFVCFVCWWIERKVILFKLFFFFFFFSIKDRLVYGYNC